MVVPLGETIIKKWPERANAQVLDQFQNWGGRSSTRKRISCRRMSRPIESQLIEKLKQKKNIFSGHAPLLKYNFHSFMHLISAMQPTFLRKWSFLATLVDFFARESARFCDLYGAQTDHPEKMIIFRHSQGASTDLPDKVIIVRHSDGFLCLRKCSFLWLLWGPNWPSWKSDHFCHSQRAPIDLLDAIEKVITFRDKQTPS